MSKRNLSSIMVVLALTACSIKENPNYPQHDYHVFRGSMPHLGPEVRVEVNQQYPTTIVFPIKVLEAYNNPGMQIKIEKDFNKLHIVARSTLSEEGEKLRVDTVDGRQYRLRILPAKERPKGISTISIKTFPKVPRSEKRASRS